MFLEEHVALPMCLGSATFENSFMKSLNELQSIPLRLKPSYISDQFGTAEAVPFQNSDFFRDFSGNGAAPRPGGFAGAALFAFLLTLPRFGAPGASVKTRLRDREFWFFARREGDWLKDARR